MAPDETMMTLCPSFLSFTAVSTIEVKMESRGSWVFSSTMELVPEWVTYERLFVSIFLLCFFFRFPVC